MKLGNYLKEFRKKNNMTQQDLADKLFVTKQAVSKWETERGTPDLETLKDISKFINVSVDDLLDVKNDAKKKKCKERVSWLLVITALFLIVVISLVVFVISSPNNKTEQKPLVFLNGPESKNIEVGSSYIEEGVSVTAGYRYEIEGVLDTSNVGVYELHYLIKNESNETVKTFIRIINVIDTTAPIFVEAESFELYTKQEYTLEDFISDYYDNFTTKKNININILTPLIFNEPGTYEIKIEFVDEADNKSLFVKEVNVLALNNYNDVNEFVNAMIEDKKAIWILNDLIEINIDENIRLQYNTTNQILELRVKYSSNYADYAYVNIQPANNSYKSSFLTYQLNKKDEEQQKVYILGFSTFDVDLNKKYNEDYSFDLAEYSNNDYEFFGVTKNEMLQVANECILQTIQIYQGYIHYNWTELKK